MHLFAEDLLVAEMGGVLLGGTASEQLAVVVIVVGVCKRPLEEQIGTNPSGFANTTDCEDAVYSNIPLGMALSY
jgi:hypothetical protein